MRNSVNETGKRHIPLDLINPKVFGILNQLLKFPFNFYSHQPFLKFIEIVKPQVGYCIPEFHI